MELRQAFAQGSIHSAGAGVVSITPSCLQWQHPLYFFFTATAGEKISLVGEFRKRLFVPLSSFLPR
nr:F319 [uncultured bacterium]